MSFVLESRMENIQETMESYLGEGILSGAGGRVTSPSEEAHEKLIL